MANVTNDKLVMSQEVWYELIGFIDENDRQEAAESFLDLLIDNDIPVQDIKVMFKGDEWVSESIAALVGETHHSDEQDEWDDDPDEIYEDY